MHQPLPYAPHARQSSRGVSGSIQNAAQEPSSGQATEQERARPMLLVVMPQPHSRTEPQDHNNDFQYAYAY